MSKRMSQHEQVAAEGPTDEQVSQVRAYLIRLAKHVTKAKSFQVLRRDRTEGDIEYQIFADAPKNGIQIAWVQSTRQDAEFISACLAQAPLFEELLAESTRLRAQLSRSETASAENTRLRAVLAESAAVCACGCSDVDHESYGEDGESCGHDDHECYRTSPAASSALSTLRAQLAQQAQQIAALVEKLKTTIEWCEISGREAKVDLKHLHEILAALQTAPR